MKQIFKITFMLLILDTQAHAQKIFVETEQSVSGEEISEDYKYLCGDLLEIYAQKPDRLEFVGCKRVEESQTIVRAIYRVSGKKSKEVEDFLVNNYGMGRLKWACCGWDTGGKYGSFEHPKLTAVHPDLSVIIDMYASGEVANKNNPAKVKLETKREKIDYFTVVVELAII